MITENLWLPLVLSLIAGLSTVIGGFVILLYKNFKKSHLSFFLGLSAGVMIYISFTELLTDAISEIGFVYANGAFFLGMILIMLIDFFIPHKYITELSCKGQSKKTS